MEKAFDYWQFFIDTTRQMHAPLYTKIAEGIARDDEMRALAHTVRKGQPPANILLASVHYLLLKGASDSLRRFYPNLNGGLQIEDEDPYPHFKAFVAAHRAELEPLIVTRITNTNEVGRSAFLHAGFRALAREAGEPLQLIELGPSAGLNQMWDRFGVRLRRDDACFALGPLDAPLVLDVELRGERSPPLGPTPRVASRVGIERDPVDVEDANARDWLRALIWPDHISRFIQLEKALDLAAREPPRITAGDALALLPETVSTLSESQPVCVYHTFVTYQFSEVERAGLNHMLIAMSLRRPVWRLSVEQRHTGDVPMHLYSYRDGVRQARHVADCSGHGDWLEWRE